MWLKCLNIDMNKIQQLIIDTYNQKPKHFTQILKRNNEVLSYLKDNVDQSKPFLEQLYLATHNEVPICKNGNKKQLKTFNGYTFCGKPSVCKCAKDSVSASVSNTKQKYTDEKNKEINNKRLATTLERYGVTNNGQTDIAKIRHKEFYSNQENIDRVTEHIKSVKLEKYGNENYNNVEKIIKTNLERYGVKNTWSLTEDKQNPLLENLKDKNILSSLFSKYTPKEISNLCDVHEMTVYRYLREHGITEPYKSTFEKEIIYFLNNVGITNIVTNKRTIIGKELDIFLPDYNLAIEFNGIYWHHDQIPYITKNYHFEKFMLCEEKGIELFTIFSDSWDNKKDIWKDKIISKLRLSKTRVYARNTTIVTPNITEIRTILDNNHTQGYTSAQICYGLKDNYGTLVALMTFSKKRAGIGKDRGDDSYELVRYVSSKTVVGGASKLLKHFINVHSPKLIFSYSDNQYSHGNLYKTLGFTLESNNTPGYRYYDPRKKKSFHRFNFTKSKLVKLGFDTTKTEFKIMDELGYLRIWDCGSKTWVLEL